VAATYVVATWLIIQVVSVVNAPLNLPEWFETVVVLLLAIGFPIAILFAWAFELTPEGIRATQTDGVAGSQSGDRKLDYALIGALLFVAAATLWGKIPSSIDVPALNEKEIVQEQSIAVLPFVDMSPSGDQEYFGDGIAEELLNELTRLDGLRVAGRTSSFSYKNRDDDILTIAKALNVNSILEGSIRKDGNRIRVTAQLINAVDGYHYWSETYDRELTDIFAIQEDIASAVAGALGVRLGVGDVNSFRGAGTRNVEAYEIYLQALQTSVLGESDERIRAFERAIELDPSYAAAWAALGLTIGATMWIAPPEEAPTILDRAIPILLKAVELDPDSAYANTLLATVNYARMDWVRSEEFYLKALSLRTDRNTLNNYANMLMRAGRSTSAQNTFRKHDAIESVPGRSSELRANVELARERFAEAKEIANQLSEFERSSLNYLIALNERDPVAIKAAISTFPKTEIASLALYLPVLRDFDSTEKALSIIKAVYADTETRWPSKYHDISLLAAYFGDAAFALHVMSNEARFTTVRFGALWYPILSEVRMLPGFKELITDVNLHEYWRTHGWADHCRPLGDKDFTCN